MRSPRLESLRPFAATVRRDAEAGQGLIEYGLILSLSAVWAALLLFAELAGLNWLSGINARDGIRA
jgi:hypothetical protein